MRFAARVTAYVGGVLLTAAGFIACTEMIQSMSENNGSPVPLSWISANLTLDPHQSGPWLASVGVLLAGVIGLACMRAIHRRS